MPLPYAHVAAASMDFHDFLVEFFAVRVTACRRTQRPSISEGPTTFRLLRHTNHPSVCFDRQILISPKRARQFPAVEKRRFFAKFRIYAPPTPPTASESFTPGDLRPKAHQPPGGGRWTSRAHPPFVSHFTDKPTRSVPRPWRKMQRKPLAAVNIHPASLRGL